MGAQGRITDNHLIEIILMGKRFCKGLGGNGAVTVVIIYFTGYLKTVFLFFFGKNRFVVRDFRHVIDNGYPFQTRRETYIRR